MISVKNGGPRVESLKVNGKRSKVDSVDRVVLPYDALPGTAKVELVMGGPWPAGAQVSGDGNSVPEAPAGTGPVRNTAGFPEDMAKPYDALVAMRSELSHEASTGYAGAFLAESIAAFDAWRGRADGYYTGQYGDVSLGKRGAILTLYRATALNMYSAFDSLMNRYASDPDPGRQSVARSWRKAR